MHAGQQDDVGALRLGRWFSAPRLSAMRQQVARGPFSQEAWCSFLPPCDPLVRALSWRPLQARERWPVTPVPTLAVRSPQALAIGVFGQFYVLDSSSEVVRSSPDGNTATQVLSGAIFEYEGVNNRLILWHPPAF